MGLYNNVPTFTYISATGITVSYNNKVYTVQSFYTNKKYIYWDSDNGTVLQASNTMPTRSSKVHLVLINDNGIVTTVPSTHENFEISYDGDSDDAIKSRIYALYQKDKELGDKYIAIEQDVDGIRQIIGTSDGKDGTIIDRVSKVEQYADKINLSVGENKKEYEADKEAAELRDSLNSAIISLNSDLGITNSKLQDYYKDDKISNEEKTSIQAMITQLENSKSNVLSYIDDVKKKASSGDITSLDNSVNELNSAHTHLVQNINTAISDSAITPTEKTVIINAFANYNLKINEFKNTCDDIIFLGVDGVISEKLALISMNSNEIKLSVSSAETSFSSKLENQSEALNKEIANAKKELSEEIDEVLSSLGDLETDINESFRDGVLSDAEKTSISQQLQRLQKEKEDIDNQYEALYNNTFLVDATTYKPKSELKTAYTRFSNRYDSLITAINTVINKTTNITDTDRSNIESAMSGYREASSNYTAKATNAIDSIANKRAEDQSSKVDKKYSEIILSEDGILNKVSYIEREYATTSTVEQTKNSLIATFKESGGYNRLYNGAFLTGDLTHWSNWGTCTRTVGDSTTSGLAKCVTITVTGTNQGIQQTVTGLLAGKKYTLSALVQAGSGVCAIQVNNNGSYHSAVTTTTGKYQKLSVTFTASTTQVTVQLGRHSSGSNGTYYYTGVLLTEGDTDIPWSPHPSEVYEGVTTIDKNGIKVSQSNYNGYTQMKADGFYVNNGSENVISVTSSGATFKGKVTIQSGSTVPTGTLSGTISSSQLDQGVKDSISNAQSTADSAKADAATANSKLSEIANDNKLTASEKQSVKLEWDKIVGEKPKIVADATTYSQSYTTYVNKYDTLNTYLSPLLSSLTTTSDIVGSTFRSHFTNYYNARQDLLNAISAAAKKLADNAQSTANSAQTTLNNNKDNWSNAFNRVKDWAYGAVTGSTNINGGLIQSNTILAKHIASGQIIADHISSKTLTGVTIKNSAGTFVVNPSGSITIGDSSSYRTHITNMGMTFNDSNGYYYSKLSGGRFYFTDNSGNNVGHVGRSIWSNSSIYLTALNADYGNTAVIGAKQSSSSSTYITDLIESSISQWIGSNYYYQGLNIINPYVGGKAYFRGSTSDSTFNTYLGKIYNTTSDYLCLEGYQRTYLSTYGGTGMYAAYNSSAKNGSDMHLYANMYCHNFYLYNAYVSTSLSATSSYTRSLKDNSSLDMYTYAPYSLTQGELRYTQREPMTTYEEYDNGNSTGRYICYCELPIFMAENLELNYHINIGKISFGDYKIIEKTQYYFILESEKEGFAFTYEVVGKQIEKSDNNAVVANIGFSENEEEEVKGLEYEMN